MKITATKISQSNGKDFFEPQSGNVFVGVKFEIKNISDETQTVSSLLLFDAYVDDVKCEYSLSANCVFAEGAIDGDIAPGKKLIGWYGVEVPKNWKTLEFNVKSNWLSNNSATFKFKNK